MTRVLGIDLGERWIGVAVADTTLRLATPRPEIDLCEGTTTAEALRAVVDSEPFEALVIGMPYTLRGEVGPQASRVLEVLEELRRVIQIPIYQMDERLTSKQAGPETKGRRDSSAAVLILQSWLDRQDAKKRRAR